MAKLSYDDYLKMMRDPEVDDETLMSFSKVQRGKGAFDWTLVADPEKVEMSAEDIEFESAMKIGNGLSRFRRQAKFRRRIFLGEKLPVLVSEGDSWFQFPLLISETIDQLGDEYLIWSVGAAGDTAQNIVFNTPGSTRTEYMIALRKEKARARGFLFSAAGNDIIGEDPDTQIPVLHDILKPFNGNKDDIVGHINMALVGEKLSFLKRAYTTVIDTIRAEPGLEKLPIFIHGYDYVFPHPWGDDDPRHPVHAAKNEWIGKPLDDRNIKDQMQRRNILIFLIDMLYDMFEGLAGDSNTTGVWLVDCRGAMPKVEDWADEIHGTSKGFSKVAARFRPVIERGIAASHVA